MLFLALLSADTFLLSVWIKIWRTIIGIFQLPVLIWSACFHKRTEAFISHLLESSNKALNTSTYNCRALAVCLMEIQFAMLIKTYRSIKLAMWQLYGMARLRFRLINERAFQNRKRNSKPDDVCVLMSLDALSWPNLEKKYFCLIFLQS